MTGPISFESVYLHTPCLWNTEALCPIYYTPEQERELFGEDLYTFFQGFQNFLRLEKQIDIEIVLEFDDQTQRYTVESVLFE